MNFFFIPEPRTNAFRYSAVVLALLGAVLVQPVLAQTKPSQEPLLVNPTGAKPNLMLTMDNSGSMAYPVHETYGINSASKTNDATLGNRWNGQRSAQVNPIYYDPRVNYTPRKNSNGEDIAPTDNIIFVSNQNSANFEYYATYSGTNFVTANSMTANGSTKPGGVPGINTINLPRAGGTASLPNNYHLDNSNAGVGTKSIPQHITYSNATTTAALDPKPVFTWVVCTDVKTVGGLQVGCGASSVTNVTYGSTDPITIPAAPGLADGVDPDKWPNRSAACPSNVCPIGEEIRNILTWYRYYSTRSTASATAIGQALANADFYSNLRVGYMTIDRPASGAMQTTNETTPSSDTNPAFSRGVRLLSKGSANTTALYNWLYTFPVAGGTPLHNSVDRIARYYRIRNEVTENPYRTNPTAATSSTNPELSCRRSFNLLFSDGSWTASSRTNEGENSDFEQGDEFTSADGVDFRYEPQGIDTADGRKAYTPYGGASEGGLADLTAKYYWTMDFTNLANNVTTDPDNGKPTFWQNMATYTVGYQVKPSGEVLGATSGLTFKQIRDYTSEYASDGYDDSTKPSWPTGEMKDQVDAKRVDDFIQAGYTGGGRGYSATSAADVRNIFDEILKDVIGASGSDAGVAVSSSSGASTLSGNLKYLVTFNTRNNFGDLTAYTLDDKGNVQLDADDKPISTWTANEKMPAPDDRNVFTMSGLNSPKPLKGNFSSLENDIKAALSIGDNTPSRIITSDSSFVDYLRGEDPTVDANGVLFRQRPGILGAMVNPPSVYMGGSNYIRYDSMGSTATGKEKFYTYAQEKAIAPASVVVATNAGAAHVLNAQTGEELAAFMPRRSLSHMLHNARENYKFEYVLDGPLSEHDVYNETTEKWQHIAIGTGGRGEKLLYALRSPINESASGQRDRQPTVDDFLWETGPTDLPEGSTETAVDQLNADDFKVGYMTNEAQTGQTENGTWVAVVNSGHYNGVADGSKHGLLLVDPFSGEVVTRIPLPASISAGRGLSGITMIRNSDLRIVGAYAGDANGNLWRFNLMGPKTSWDVNYDKPLYTTENNRPIYGNPAWQKHPKGGAIVVFATGMLLEDSDIADTTINESIYGIWDPTLIDGTEKVGFTTRSTSKLLVQSVSTTAATTDTTNLRNYYASSGNTIDWAEDEGWRMALGWKTAGNGERNLTGVMNLKKNVIIATTEISLPTEQTLESCTVTRSPTNYIYSLRALDGRVTPSFDTDADGKANDVSVMEVSSGGYSRGNSLVRTDKSDSDGSGGGTGGDFDPPIPGYKGEDPLEPCSPASNDKAATLIGVGDKATQIFSVCPSSNWSRTQYQLSEPPSAD